jgi:hypothetical protein
MRSTQAGRILEYLKDHAEGAYAYELANELHCLQYNARIYELRHKGWDIENDHEGHFILHREPIQLSI